MDAVNELMKEAVHVVMYHIKTHLDYMISYKTYEKEMRAKMESLDIARAGEKKHLDRNRRNHLVVPDEITPWLEKVEKIKEKVENFPREGLGCLNLKSRYKLGSKALEITKEIDSVLPQHSLIKWTDQPIPAGRIDPTMIISGDHNNTEFRSREQTFTEALEALRPNHSSHMVALCGMGGVGKTTMMRKLKEAVAKERLFTDYVEAVIGEKTDPIAVQQAVADFLGINLTNNITKSARTEMLHKWFAENSDGGKKKFLVILDDVWQSVDMEDIGLSRLANRGVDFKVLITSRDQAVCTEMGVRLDSVFQVNVLEDAEAQSLFDQHWVPSHNDDYYELHQIGRDIVKKCHGLPIAIKTMACTLSGKHVDTWRNALDRLQNHDIKTFVNAVFQTSYVNLRDEVTEGIFLLCGLFPEDFNIPTEELLWYGRGLNLFKGVGTIRQARYKLNASIERLIHTNLLIKSDNVGCVKMHDLVRAFVLGMCSEHSIVNHGSNKPGWPAETDIVRASCKKISLTFKGTIEFPSDLNFPNLLILKLMHGWSLRFPEGFYEGMGKQLQVISYDDIMTEYPMPLFSSQLTSLRVLRLHGCYLESDDHWSSIGNLLNLEMISFAKCSIESLPISVGELKKLRVLDVTDCHGLCIDYSVFKNLHSLEELYACASDTINFTGDDHNNYIHEVAQRWQNISSLEFEFLKFDAQWKNLSFEKLERFQISVGHSLEKESFISVIKEVIKEHSLENWLQLVTNKSEVFKSGINKLFKKTVVLGLSVDDMTDLEDVGLIKSSLPPDSSPFFKLKVLFVYECAKLIYLFTPDVAKSLLNLERLGVSSCPVMKQLIHTEDRGEETITFPKLKRLVLSELPELVELEKRGVDDQCGFSEALVGETGEGEGGSSLYSMKVTKLGKEVSETQGINKSVTTLKLPNLNTLRIEGCDRLKHIFTFSTFESLIQLEELDIRNCKAMKVIVEETTTPSSSSSKAPAVVKFPHLSKIRLWSLPELVGFFLGTDIEFHWPSLESVWINNCPRMRVFTAGGSTAPQLKYVQTNIGMYSPECLNSRVTTTTTTTGRLHQKVLQTPCPSLDGSSSSCPAATSEEINIWSFHNLIELHMEYDESVKKIIPSNDLLQLQKLQKIMVSSCDMVEEVFEALEAGTNSSTTGFDNKSQTTTHVNLPNLTQVELKWLPRLRHIWRSNKWTVFEFPNLTTVHVHSCERLKHVFSSSMAGSLLQLQELQIRFCENMEEVFVVDEDRESEDKTNEIVFHSLKSLELYWVPCLKGFCIGKVDFSFPSLDTLTIGNCQAITTFTTGNSSTLNLKEIQTGFGLFYVEENINSFIKMKQDEFSRDKHEFNRDKHDINPSSDDDEAGDQDV